MAPSPTAAPSSTHSRPQTHDNEFINLLNSQPVNGKSGSFSSIITCSTSLTDNLDSVPAQEKVKRMASPLTDSAGATPDSSEKPDDNIKSLHAGSISDSQSSSDDYNEEEEEARILRRLKIRRKQIDEEIEAFVEKKEREYKSYETHLRDRRRRRRSRRVHEPNVPISAQSHPEKLIKETAHPTPKVSGPSAEEFTTFPRAQASSSGSVDFLTKKSFPNLAPHLPGTSTPPFEKEIQLAGLFTPRYLPLLDNSYNSSVSSVVASPRPSTPTRPTLSEISTTIHERPSSPVLPLASSLKSSGSSGGSIASGSSQQLKPKSPKRVTFKLDETKAIPSRSSPPETVSTFKDDTLLDDEEDIDELEVEQAEAIEDHRAISSKTYTRQGAVSSLPGLERPINEVMGDTLVTPMVIGDGVVEVAGGGLFREGGIGLGEVNWNDNLNNQAPPSADEDDEEDLFDMDETIPISPTQEDSDEDTGIRSPSPGFDGDEQILTGSFRAIASHDSLTDPASLPKNLSLPPGELPVTNFPTGRRISLNPPFSFNKSLQNVNSLVASLPSHGFASGGKKGAGSFRRRSVTKYVDDDEEEDDSLSGLPNRRYDTLDEEEEGDITFTKTSFGTSLPIQIRRPEDKPVEAIAEGAAVLKDEEIAQTGSPPDVETDGAHEAAAFNMDEDDLSPSQKPPIPLPRVIPPPAVAYPTSSSPPVDSTTSSGSLKFIQPFSSYSRSPINLITTPPRLSPTYISPSTTSLGSTTAATIPVANSSISAPNPVTTQPPPSSKVLNPFYISSKASPYATSLAAAVAAQAAHEPAGYDIGSVVGGINGQTGLDPDPDAVGNMGRRGSLAWISSMSNRGLSGIAHDEGRKRAATLMGGGGGGNVRGGSVRGAGMGMGTGTGKAGKGDSGGIGMGIGEEDKPLIPEQMSFSMRFALEEHMGGRGK